MFNEGWEGKIVIVRSESWFLLLGRGGGGEACRQRLIRGGVTLTSPVDEREREREEVLFVRRGLVSQNLAAEWYRTREV